MNTDSMQRTTHTHTHILAAKLTLKKKNNNNNLNNLNNNNLIPQHCGMALAGHRARGRRGEGGWARDDKSSSTANRRSMKG